MFDILVLSCDITAPPCHLGYYVSNEVKCRPINKICPQRSCFITLSSHFSISTLSSEQLNKGTFNFLARFESGEGGVEFEGVCFMVSWEVRQMFLSCCCLMCFCVKQYEMEDQTGCFHSLRLIFLLLTLWNAGNEWIMSLLWRRNANRGYLLGFWSFL